MNRAVQAVLIPPALFRTVPIDALFGAVWILFSALLTAHFSPVAQTETVSNDNRLLFIERTALAPGLLLDPFFCLPFAPAFVAAAALCAGKTQT